MKEGLKLKGSKFWGLVFVFGEAKKQSMVGGHFTSHPYPEQGWYSYSICYNTQGRFHAFYKLLQRHYEKMHLIIKR